MTENNKFGGLIEMCNQCVSKYILLLYIYNLVFHSSLTFHVQRHWVALAVAFLVTAHARVNSGTGSGYFLQHKTLIADYRARRRIVIQQLSLCADQT